MLKSEKGGDWHPAISFHRDLRRRALFTPGWNSQTLDRMRSRRPWTSSFISTNAELGFVSHAELALSRDTIWPISSSITLDIHTSIHQGKRLTCKISSCRRIPSTLIRRATNHHVQVSLPCRIFRCTMVSRAYAVFMSVLQQRLCVTTSAKIILKTDGSVVALLRLGSRWPCVGSQYLVSVYSSQGQQSVFRS